jgi:hypothetical protein
MVKSDGSQNEDYFSHHYAIQLEAIAEASPGDSCVVAVEHEDVSKLRSITGLCPT